jgi:hypothetical protein
MQSTLAGSRPEAAARVRGKTSNPTPPALALVCNDSAPHADVGLELCSRTPKHATYVPFFLLVDFPPVYSVVNTRKMCYRELGRFFAPLRKTHADRDTDERESKASIQGECGRNLHRQSRHWRRTSSSSTKSGTHFGEFLSGTDLHSTRAQPHETKGENIF